MLLTGTFTRSIDEKLRVAIPKRLREVMGVPPQGGLFVAPGTDRTLAIYTEDAFRELAERWRRPRPRNTRSATSPGCFTPGPSEWNWTPKGGSGSHPSWPSWLAWATRRCWWGCGITWSFGIEAAGTATWPNGKVGLTKSPRLRLATRRVDHIQANHTRCPSDVFASRENRNVSPRPPTDVSPLPDGFSRFSRARGQGGLRAANCGTTRRLR